MNADFLFDPWTAVTAALMAPFMARLIAIASMETRVSGWLWPIARTPTGLRRDDFPRPNDWRREIGLAAVALVPSIGAGFAAQQIVGPTTPPFVWTLVYLLGVAPSVVWLFRRLRGQDQIAVDARLRRVAETMTDRFTEAAAKDHLW